MANERLSKLQKWILEQTYKLEVLHNSSVVGKTNGFYHRLAVSGDAIWANHSHMYRYFEPWIYEHYYQLSPKYGDNQQNLKDYRKAHVTVHRAINNMEDKGLIDVTRYHTYKMKNWGLTEKGLILAEQLLNVKEMQAPEII